LWWVFIPLRSSPQVVGGDPSEKDQDGFPIENVGNDSDEDGFPINTVGNDNLTPAYPQVVGGDPSEE